MFYIVFFCYFNIAILLVNKIITLRYTLRVVPAHCPLEYEKLTMLRIYLTPFTDHSSLVQIQTAKSVCFASQEGFRLSK